MPSKEASSFLETFEARYGAPPSSIYAVLAGDGFRIIAAIKSVGLNDPTKLADYLHKELKNFPGLLGMISLNEKGDRVGEVYRAYTVDAEGNFNLRF